MKDAHKLFEKQLFDIALRVLKIRTFLPDKLPDEDAVYMKDYIDSCVKNIQEFQNVAFGCDVDELDG